MLKNHCKTLKICLFGQTTKQPTSNFVVRILKNTNNMEGWGLVLVAYEKVYWTIFLKMQQL